MSKEKTLKSFRFSSRTIRDLEQLATHWGVTQTDVLTILIQNANKLESVLDENEDIQTAVDMVRRVRGM
jgi:predicted DNA-binding protein